MSERADIELRPEDWEELKRLRQTFLSESFSSQKNYWGSTQLLQLYHQSFAQRIGWKWDSVLRELKEKNVFQKDVPRVLIDYGCGTGIASQKIINSLGEGVVSSVYFGDKSSAAVRFAMKTLSDSHAGVLACPLDLTNLPNEKWILCLSHLINELDGTDIGELIPLVEKSEFVIWVEPGTSSTSRQLIEFREMISEKMEILAPCTHQQKCGMLSKENNRHWCHFFAVPPNEVFQSAFWGQFSCHLSIDLRSLPTSFLVLKAKNTGSKFEPLDSRIVGRPRLYKGNGKFLICNSSGVSEATLLERNHKELFKEFKKDVFCKILPEGTA